MESVKLAECSEKGKAEKVIFFFDIDNCLYPRTRGVRDHMAHLIEQYFIRDLSLLPDDARKLQETYLIQYGLALEGLIRHHKIDPLEYNRKVDDALPLEELIKPDPHLRELILRIDRSKVRLWLFTNAYVTHGKRVVDLLGIADLFEGMTYCDYANPPLLCKPDKRSYAKAMTDAGIMNPSMCYFVDDSAINTIAAQELGWHTAHILEPEDPAPEKPAADFTIRNLQALRTCFPQLFLQA